MSFIGPKEIENSQESQTPTGIAIVEVSYKDGTKETLSKLMYDAVVDKSACDLTALRQKRMEPVVGATLAVLRLWGIKLSELPYFSALLNNSLDASTKEAEKLLWQPWIPTMQDVDDIDLIAVDRVLRAQADAE